MDSGQAHLWVSRKWSQVTVGSSLSISHQIQSGANEQPDIFPVYIQSGAGTHPDVFPVPEPPAHM